MESNNEFLSIPKFEISRAEEYAIDFVAKLQHRLKHLFKNDANQKLDITGYIIDEANNNKKPIRTTHGLSYIIANNLGDHRKIEVFIDEMNKVTLSFFYLKSKRNSIHYVIKCNSSIMPIEDIIEKFIHYRLLPNFNVDSLKSFIENDWSEESINYAKSFN